MERDVKRLGLRRGNNEPAMLDLVNKVADLRMGKTLIENAHVGDSWANGRAEGAVQTLEKQVRVVKLSTENYFGERISVKHPAFTCLAMHTADVITKCQIRSGQTGALRMRGSGVAAALVMLEFGMSILYRVNAKVHGRDMEPRWRRDLRLGQRFAPSRARSRAALR